MGHSGLRFDPGLVHQLQLVDSKRTIFSTQPQLEPPALMSRPTAPAERWPLLVDNCQC